jgi:methyl coenzyme M reductase subunit C-like uncharacterized protein (methanogenesis marker protein 7)
MKTFTVGSRKIAIVLEQINSFCNIHLFSVYYMLDLPEIIKEVRSELFADNNFPLFMIGAKDEDAAEERVRKIIRIIEASHKQ